MSTKFFNDLETLVKIAEIDNSSSKLVSEAKNYLKKIISLAIKDIEQLIAINNNIDNLITHGEFLINEDYPRMCHDSNKLFSEIYDMMVVKKFNLLLCLLDSSDEELSTIVDEFLYLIYIRENDIKARQNMSFGWIYSK